MLLNRKLSTDLHILINIVLGCLKKVDTNCKAKPAILLICKFTEENPGETTFSY